MSNHWIQVLGFNKIISSSLTFSWLGLLFRVPVAVSLFLSKVGEKVMVLKHRSLLSFCWSQGYFGGPDSLGRCLFPPSLFSSSQPHFWLGKTEDLSPQRYLFVKGTQMNCTSFLELKHFYPCFLFSWPFLFIEILQESVLKWRVDSILGRHILVAQFLSHLAALLFTP